MKIIKRLCCKHKSLEYKGYSEWKVLENTDVIKREIRYEKYECLNCGKSVDRAEIRENGKIYKKN